MKISVKRNYRERKFCVKTIYMGTAEWLILLYGMFVSFILMNTDLFSAIGTDVFKGLEYLRDATNEFTPDMYSAMVMGGHKFHIALAELAQFVNTGTDATESLGVRYVGAMAAAAVLSGAFCFVFNFAANLVKEVMHKIEDRKTFKFRNVSVTTGYREKETSAN